MVRGDPSARPAWRSHAPSVDVDFSPRTAHRWSALRLRRWRGGRLGRQIAGRTRSANVVEAADALDQARVVGMIGRVVDPGCRVAFNLARATRDGRAFGLGALLGGRLLLGDRGADPGRAGPRRRRGGDHGPDDL